MAVDLHTHSRISDGSDTPSELVALAAEAGLSAMALTDHDTQEGIAEAREAAARADIELIPGVEVSCGKGTHLVALFLEPGPGPLQDRLAAIRHGRETRNARMVERLVELGIDITLGEVEQEARVGVVGRPHFAAVLIRKGAVETMNEAFDRYLGNRGAAYVPRETFSIEEALPLARASGAVPVLAHPHTPELGDEPYGGEHRRGESTVLVMCGDGEGDVFLQVPPLADTPPDPSVVPTEGIPLEHCEILIAAMPLLEHHTVLVR